jgi:GntR family transcriptional regulator, rspAB operon transcriptional repressor
MAPTVSSAFPPLETLRLDRTRQAAPQVFEHLRELIVSLELPPGTLLARAELAEAFGVSQTPVRDALIRLGEEGLVDIFPQHATVVSRIDTASAGQVHFMRKAIEGDVAAKLATDRDPVLLARLREQLRRQAALAAADDYASFILADQEFHQRMYIAAGVPDLFDLVRRLSGHVDRLRRLHLPVKGKARGVVRDHTRIVDAIDSGDGQAARQAVLDHLSGTLGQVEQLRAAHPDYVT